MDGFVTTEQLKSFYHMDRQIFARMVVNLGYGIAQSAHIIALWIWMENTCIPNTFVCKLLNEGDEVLNSVAKEASTCIKYIEETMWPPQPNMDLPVTSDLFGRRISLGFLHENRVKVLSTISKMADGNLRRAFQDIAEVELTRRLERAREKAMISTAASIGNASVPNNLRMILPNKPIGQRGVQPQRQPQCLNPTAQPWSPNINTPQEARTMFVTFSRGYPVSEEEITEFFTRLYGDCVEGIQKEEVPPSEQPLFAQVVFRTATMIQMVLSGQAKAKFIINGKHIWMRKYVPKFGRA